MKQKLALLLIFLALIAGYLLSTALNSSQSNQAEVNSYRQIRSLPIPLRNSEQGSIMLNVTMEAVKTQSGGDILIEAERLEFLDSFLRSARQGVAAAETYLGYNITNRDLILRLNNDEKVLTGYSAGSAVSILTIAVITNRNINEGVSITGTINKSGAIGPIGGLSNKVKAAKERNVTLLLPADQNLTQLQDQDGYQRYIKRVSDLGQAADYMLNE